MKTRLGHDLLAIVLATAGFSVGCGRAAGLASPAAPSAPKTTVFEKGPAVDPAGNPDRNEPVVSSQRISHRPANPNGKVFIVEYHHIRVGKGDMFRTTAEFRRDLERLDKDRFRPCTVSQYLDNKMPLPPGASPVVFTFDDSNPSQLQLTPDGKVDPNCAVGIWQDFAKMHPDFPVRATFYVLPDVMWGQPKFRAAKVALIKQLGCELGNHTVTHPILRKLSDERVKQEIGVATDRLEKLGTLQPVSLALPFGVSPKNKELTKAFDYHGKHYEMKAALLVGAEPARSPTDPKLNRFRIPRIQAYNGVCGLNEWLDKFEKGSIKTYVAP